MSEDKFTDHWGRTYVTLRSKEQADALVSDESISEALDWFDDKRGVPERDFIDKLSDTYGIPAGAEDGFEIPDYDGPAARSVLARARKMKKERVA